LAGHHLREDSVCHDGIQASLLQRSDNLILSRNVGFILFGATARAGE